MKCKLLAFLRHCNNVNKSSSMMSLLCNNYYFHFNAGRLVFLDFFFFYLLIKQPPGTLAVNKWPSLKWHTFSKKTCVVSSKRPCLDLFTELILVRFACLCVFMLCRATHLSCLCIPSHYADQLNECMWGFAGHNFPPLFLTRQKILGRSMVSMATDLFACCIWW